MDQMRLRDAGVREHEFAQGLIKQGKFPVGVDFDTLLDHGVYDANTDEIVLTVKAAVFRYRVSRP